MKAPRLGPQTPRGGNALTRLAGRAVLGAIGWRFEGAIPDVPRCVIIVAPHTSNWDYVVGLAALFALGMGSRYLAKHTLFRGPLGWLLSATGGIPVDRDAPGGVLARVVEEMRSADRIYLSLAPEGTRRKTERWRSGFHRIARGAGVPIVPVAFDYRARLVRLMPLFNPTEDYERDLAALRSLYAPEMARYPQNY